jgi:hypothetical protein
MQYEAIENYDYSAIPEGPIWILIRPVTDHEASLIRLPSVLKVRRRKTADADLTYYTFEIDGVNDLTTSLDLEAYLVTHWKVRDGDREDID